MHPKKCKVFYLPLILPEPGGAYKQKSRCRREWIGVSKGIFFLQFSLQWNFLPSLPKIYSKHIFSTISYTKNQAERKFWKACMILQWLDPMLCLSPRHCQYRDFLVHSFNPLNFQVKTLKCEIFFVRCFDNGGHQDLHLVEVKINYMMLTVAK